MKRKDFTIIRKTLCLFWRTTHLPSERKSRYNRKTRLETTLTFIQSFMWPFQHKIIVYKMSVSVVATWSPSIIKSTTWHLTFRKQKITTLTSTNLVKILVEVDNNSLTSCPGWTYRGASYSIFKTIALDYILVSRIWNLSKSLNRRLNRKPSIPFCIKSSSSKKFRFCQPNRPRSLRSISKRAQIKVVEFVLLQPTIKTSRLCNCYFN